MASDSILVLLLATTAVTALLALVLVLSRKQKTEDASKAYLAGVRYVLSDEPDAAFAELSRAARMNTATYDTYFALAALMRRKGELAWAIRLAQNMLLKPALPREVRRRAQLELALDFRRSGMQDRARDTFEGLLAEAPADAEALLAYRQLLEEARDWPRAVEVQERLLAVSNEGQSVLAHLLCELATVTRPTDAKGARALADRAASLDPGSAHPRVEQARSALALGDQSGAQSALREALEREPELAPATGLLLLDAGLSPAEAASWFASEAERKVPAAGPLTLARAEALVRGGRADQAVETLQRLLQREPGFLEARRAVGELLLAGGPVESLRDAYRDVLRTLGEPVLAFVCRACQAKFPAFFFRCPGCGAWDQLGRARSQEFDQAAARA
ncbi:MAG: tetratricopeptide repeat protein [Myxococcaceae bacterium]